MRNVLVSWELPMTRQQGGPLAPGEISHTAIDLSADGGLNWTSAPNVPADVAQEVPFNDLPFGDAYSVRLTVFDMQGRGGIPLETPFAVYDESPPGQVQNVTVTFP